MHCPITFSSSIFSGPPACDTAFVLPLCRARCGSHVPPGGRSQGGMNRHLGYLPPAPWLAAVGEERVLGHIALHPGRIPWTLGKEVN